MTINLVERARNHRTILRVVRASEPAGITAEELVAALDGVLSASLVKGHLCGLVDDMRVYWDEGSPRRIHER